MLTSLVKKFTHTDKTIRQSDKTKLPQGEYPVHSKELPDNRLLLDSITHETRNALHGITGTAKYLIEDWGNISDDERKKQVMNIARTSNNTKLFLDSIIDFSKLRSGTYMDNACNVDLIELIEECISECRIGHIFHKDITLKFNRDSLEEAIVLGEEQLFYRVLMNLVTNAIKYTDHGVVSIILEKNDSGGKTYFTTSVIDEGIGIPDAEAENIFKPFFRSSLTRTSKMKGTGLGLCIAKTIVEAFGGKIWFSNNHGKAGATFSFMLPASRKPIQKENPPVQNNTDSSQAQAPIEEKSRRAILFVDDQEACHDALKMMLHKERNFTILGAFTAEEAIDLAKNHKGKIDLALLDVMLPDMQGYELYKNLGEENLLENVPVLFQTGLIEQKEEIQELLNTGKVGVVRKPYQKEELLAAIRKLSNNF